MAATARSSRTPAKAPARPKASRPLPPAVRAAMKKAQDAGLVQIDADDAEGAEPEREPVFAIGETVHTMLADPPPTLAMAALDMAYQRGGTEQAYGLATVFLMREMLGEESYRALLASRRVTRAQYTAIVEKVTVRVYSALEGEDGSPNS